MKKLSWILCCAVLTICVMLMLPAKAHASEIVDSGTCGKNLTWTLDDAGTLTISGTGPMTYYDSFIEVPWYSRKDAIKRFVISDGVTSIEDSALLGYTELTGIWVNENNPNYSSDAQGVLFNKDKTQLLQAPGGISGSYMIPISVTSIGEGAFYNCKGLTSVSIPDGVTVISDSAFQFCDSLISVSIPNRVTSIGYKAFYGCDSLTTITVPNSVTSIGDHAFRWCTRLSITIPDDTITIGNDIVDISTPIYCNKNTAAAEYCLNTEGQVFVFLDGTDEESIIGGTVGELSWKLDKRTGLLEISGRGRMEGFYWMDSPWYEYRRTITEVKLPKGITYIGSHAFDDCTRLTSIALPNSITSIGNGAFEGCSSLQSVSLPNSITEISWGTFSGCTNLTSIIIPPNVTAIDMGCFDGCDALKSVIVYNQNCTFNEYCGLNDSVTIYSFLGSTAEAFAAEIGAEFVDVETVHTHTWQGATCTTPAICKVCGKNGSKLSHDYKAATCTAPKTCKNCGVTSGNALDHTYSNACDTSCNRCSAKRSIKHKYTNDCDTACNVCKAKRTAPHKYTNSCDTSCNLCKTKRTIKHTYTNGCDTACNVCKAKRTISHKYKTVTTKATLTKNGKVEKKCSECGKVSSTTSIKYAKTVTLSATSYTYNGKVKTPTVTVKDSAGKTLKKNTDYTVSYSSGRKNVGTYKVTIKFKGKYSGTKVLTFKINPKAASINKLTAKTKGLYVKLNRQTVQSTGYEIQYSTAKSFKSAKAVTTGYKTSTKAISGLKGRTTYYVRVRTYKTVSGVKYYSSWSTAKYMKTK